MYPTSFILDIHDSQILFLAPINACLCSGPIGLPLDCAFILDRLALWRQKLQVRCPLCYSLKREDRSYQKWQNGSWLMTFWTLKGEECLRIAWFSHGWLRIFRLLSWFVWGVISKPWAAGISIRQPQWILGNHSIGQRPNSLLFGCLWQGLSHEERPWLFDFRCPGRCRGPGHNNRRRRSSAARQQCLCRSCWSARWDGFMMASMMGLWWVMYA